MNLLALKKVSASPWGQLLLEEITLDVAAGEIVCIAGPNGAGKSSLLKLLAGDISPYRGEFRLADKVFEDIPRRELARQLAYLPQLSLLNFPYTVEEVIGLGRTPHETGASVDNDVTGQTMVAMDIQSLSGRLYTQLSGGERQRVQLARIFTQIWGPGSPQQRLLLLDEPTSALDLSHQQQLAGAVRDLAAQGCAIVLVLHDLNLAAGLADRLILLKGGKLRAVGTPSDVLTESLLKEVFDVEVSVSEHPTLQQPVVMNFR